MGEGYLRPAVRLYNEHHSLRAERDQPVFARHENKGLKDGPDGSLILYVQADPPTEAQRANWLPAPKGGDFSLYVRAYWPKTAVTDGSWTPPAVVRTN